MTDKTRQAKSYTPEFRESSVQLAIESEKPVSVVAKELDVNINTFIGMSLRILSFRFNDLPIRMKFHN